MTGWWRGLLASAVAVIVACSSTSSRIEDHPEYGKLQEEVERVIVAVRETTGPALIPHLQRLAAYDVFAVDQICELVTDPNPRLRSNAIWVLSRVEDSGYPAMRKRINRTLWRALEDPDRLVRYEAATGLLDRNHWETIPVLLEGMSDEDPRVRVNCHQALRSATNKSFGYVADAAAEEREAAVARWRDWYSSWKSTNG